MYSDGVWSHSIRISEVLLYQHIFASAISANESKIALADN